jgi:hypothetical protein
VAGSLCPPVRPSSCPPACSPLCLRCPVDLSVWLPGSLPAGLTPFFAVSQGELWKSEKEVWKIFRQLVEALAFIHTKGLIHRDIKPENIFLNDAADVMLGDFGLATVTARRASPAATATAAAAASAAAAAASAASSGAGASSTGMGRVQPPARMAAAAAARERGPPSAGASAGATGALSLTGDVGTKL